LFSKTHFQLVTFGLLPRVSKDLFRQQIIKDVDWSGRCETPAGVGARRDPPRKASTCNGNQSKY